MAITKKEKKAIENIILYFILDYNSMDHDSLREDVEAIKGRIHENMTLTGWSNYWTQKDMTEHYRRIGDYAPHKTERYLKEKGIHTDQQED